MLCYWWVCSNQGIHRAWTIIGYQVPMHIHYSKLLSAPHQPCCPGTLQKLLPSARLAFPLLLVSWTITSCCQGVFAPCLLVHFHPDYHITPAEKKCMIQLYILNLIFIHNYRCIPLLISPNSPIWLESSLNSLSNCVHNIVNPFHVYCAVQECKNLTNLWRNHHVRIFHSNWTLHQTQGG